MKVFEVGIDKLIPYIRNPRKNDRASTRMMTSIQEFGFRVPLLARRRGEEIEAPHEGSSKTGITAGLSSFVTSGRRRR
jgi:hypothetical protein